MAEIAVLMPVYNAERFLPECLDSLLNQSFPDFICLAADDGSDDSSAKILRDRAERDKRLAPLANPCNMGIAATRNILIRALPRDVKFVALMDADDLMFPDRLERQLAFLNAHPDIDAVGADLEIIDEQGNPGGFRVYPKTPAAIRNAMLSFNPLSQSSMLLRRAVIDETGFYDEKCRVASDYDYWFRAVRKFNFANLPTPVIHYRLSSSQAKQKHLKRTLSTTLRLQRKYLFDFFSLSGMIRHLAKYPLFLLPSSVIMMLFSLRVYHASRRHAK